LRVLCLILAASCFIAKGIGGWQAFDFPVDRPLLLSNRLYRV
jgi:hypothetical protein